MTAPSFRPNAKRDIAALELSEGAASWLQIRLRQPYGAFAAGTKFYGVPSSKGDGSYYYSNLKVCSCADYERRGSGCKHQRAVALHVERIHAALGTARPVRHVDNVGVDALPEGATIIRPTLYDAIFPAED